ncbi:MAG: DNA mismatch repair protein MutS, partial [candidate division Zixibacteria bacterium]
MNSPEKLTPLLKQFFTIKKQHPDRILFFRMGDFYELFGDDAVTASPILGIALTSRSQGDSGKMPLAGFPHHTLERYLAKILKAGYKVAVCDQVEDPKKAKGIVKREVVEVLTPGSITLDDALDDKKPNYLASVNPQNGMVGIALLDISTGRFFIDEFEINQLGDNLAFHSPSEVIIPDSHKAALEKTARAFLPEIAVTPIDDYRFDSTMAFNNLVSHFKTSTLDGFGLGDVGLSLGAAGAVFAHMKDLKMGKVGQITRIEKLNRDLTMELDSATIKNLELVETPYGGKKNSLLSVVDNTSTPGGGRTMRRWILSPLKDLKAVKARQNAVKSMLKSSSIRKDLIAALKGIPDLERLASKIAMRKAGPRDIISLKNGLRKIMILKTTAGGLKSSLISETIEGIRPLDDLVAIVEKAIVDEPPVFLSDSGLFKPGYSNELDILMAEIDRAKEFIHNLQTSEREKTGITSLKVGYNRVFGYYLEITRPHLAQVPDYY